MTMHCPNCRLANAATTRFCTGCGAVLVESVAGGGRRRVLRPWGLRRSAPHTESPAIPEIADALHAARRTHGRSARKLGVLLASGIAVTAVAGSLVYPYTAVHGRAERLEPPVVMVETALTLPAVATVRETQLTAPPLVEQSPTPRVARSMEPKRQAPVKPADESVAMPAPEVPVAPTIVAEAPKPAPVAVVPAPADRLDALGVTLVACGARDGLFDRAVCEQQARLDHCAGYWGNAPICPSGRYDHTQ